MQVADTATHAAPCPPPSGGAQRRLKRWNLSGHVHAPSPAPSMLHRLFGVPTRRSLLTMPSTLDETAEKMFQQAPAWAPSPSKVLEPFAVTETFIKLPNYGHSHLEHDLEVVDELYAVPVADLNKIQDDNLPLSDTVIVQPPTGNPAVDAAVKIVEIIEAGVTSAQKDLGAPAPGPGALAGGHGPLQGSARGTLHMGLAPQSMPSHSLGALPAPALHAWHQEQHRNPADDYSGWVKENKHGSGAAAASTHWVNGPWREPLQQSNFDGSSYIAGL